jgi:hypothetical protein
MSPRLLAINVVLAAAAVGSAAYIVREVTARPPDPAPLANRPYTPAAAPPAPPQPSPAAYGTIASRNLFSPSRTETAQAAPGTAVAAAPPVPKPNLYGVVLRDGAPIAYLEDPVTKRVAGYRVGDTVGGGTVQTISADRVVLARPEGQVDVRLHDPSKPRPPAPAAGPTPAPAARQPGVPQPSIATPGSRQAAEDPQRPAVESQLPPNLQPGRRVLPPNLRRRLPPGFGNDAANR